MPVFCTNCGTKNEDGAQFCDECGSKLARPINAPAAAVQTPAPAPAVAPAVAPAPAVAVAVAPAPAATPAAAPSVAPAKPVVTPAPPAPAPVLSAATSVQPAPAPAQPVVATSLAPQQVQAVPLAGATRPLSVEPLAPVGVACRLLVLQAGVAVREFTIRGVAVEIGRWDPANGAFPEVDLTEDDPGVQVSRRHAKLYRDGDRFMLEDLGSTNGTYVNRTQLTAGAPVEVTVGTEIIMGRTFLRFELG